VAAVEVDITLLRPRRFERVDVAVGVHVACRRQIGRLSFLTLERVELRLAQRGLHDAIPVRALRVAGLGLVGGETGGGDEERGHWRASFRVGGWDTPTT